VIKKCPVPTFSGTWHSAQASGSSPGAAVYPGGGPEEKAWTGRVPVLVDNKNPRTATSRDGTIISRAISALHFALSLIALILFQNDCWCL
jgi:hypothetical protein